ncbi:putative uncharacterized protein [Parabacteroides sp. CAG:409]|nr:putative uncharacterized protein [Parabacteroides sp. CAG:409]
MGFLNFLLGGFPKFSPIKITDPPRDLTKEQKFTIISLFAMIQGSSEESSFDPFAQQIFFEQARLMGLNQNEVARFLQNHTLWNRWRFIQVLKSIRDTDFLDAIFKRCLRIAQISSDPDIIYVLKGVYFDIGYTQEDIVRAWLSDHSIIATNSR